MGVTWFQLKSVKFSEPVIAFSSNYALYASMSNRVMVHLEALAPRVEQYFIDEMFLDIRGIDSCIDLGDFGRQLREHVRSGTGLTIGVGMGPTKTLAKSAVQKNCCHCSRWRKSGGGRRISKKLNTMGITTALQLARANPTFIRKNFNVVLERTVRELNGESCISLEEAPPPKQQIVVSASSEPSGLFPPAPQK